MTHPNAGADPAPSDGDPFAVLGIAPTGVLADVKRAYFAVLQKHPPHADPDGFRRIRAAYELLMKPGVLETLSWTAGFDRQAAADALAAHLEPRLASCRRARAEGDGRRFLRVRFERLVAESSWAEMTALFSGAEPAEGRAPR